VKERGEEVVADELLPLIYDENDDCHTNDIFQQEEYIGEHLITLYTDLLEQEYEIDGL
jgi:hypothetical protein